MSLSLKRQPEDSRNSRLSASVLTIARAVLVDQGKEWIDKEQQRRQPRLDLYGDAACKACEDELAITENILSNISNILTNGSDLILDRVFNLVGFNRIEDVIFRQLVKARLSYPASKAATVEYLKNHFDEDVDLSRIYRYLDKLATYNTFWYRR